MFQNIDFETINGKASDRKLVFLALSTCSFCKKARAFLDGNSFTYEILYMDKIDPELKKTLKVEFADRFKKRLTYPTLIIDDKEILTGFIRIAWEKELLEDR